METPVIFETHAHYDDEKFKEDREQLVSSLPEQNIKRVINVGARLKKYVSCPACRKLWQSERLGWIITGIKKNMNM